MTLERFTAILKEMQGVGYFPTLERHGLTPRDRARARDRWMRQAIKDVATRRRLAEAIRASEPQPRAPLVEVDASTQTDQAAQAPRRVQASYQQLASAAAPLPQQPVSAAPALPPRGPDETEAVSLDEIFAGQRLPFQEGGPSVLARLRAAAPPPQPVERTGTLALPGSETAMVDLDMAAKPSLPFDGSNAPTAAAPPEEEMSLERYAEVTGLLMREGDPERTFARLGLDPLGWMRIVRRFNVRFDKDAALKTRFDALMAAPPPRAHMVTVPRIAEAAALPVPPVLPDIPTLSVEQYAWVTAALRNADPAALPAMLARFRLTAATRLKLDDVWRAHMARHPAVKQAFDRALAQHLAT